MKIVINQGAKYLFTRSYQNFYSYKDVLSADTSVSYLYLESEEEIEELSRFTDLLVDRFKEETVENDRPLLTSTVLNTCYALIKKPENLEEYLLTRGNDSLTIKKINKAMKYLEEINYGK